MSAIVVENLYFSRSGKPILTNVNFEIGSGQIVGFLGPNGAGKTTTLRLLTGYLPYPMGSIRLLEQELADNRQFCQKRIGYLPENTPLYPDFSVRRQLAFCCALKQVPLAQHQTEIDRVLGILELMPEQHHLIYRLSKGVQQRLGLAQTLIGDPPIIFLDEPTTGLDPYQITQIRTIIRSLKETHTVVLSSHILPDVSQVCDSAIIIHHGEIILTSTIDALTADFEKGQTRFSAEIIAPVSDLKTTLGTLSEITIDAIRQPPGAAGITLEFHTPDALTGRTALFHALSARHWPLLELKPLENPLESVFLHLTKSEEPVQ